MCGSCAFTCVMIDNAQRKRDEHLKEYVVFFAKGQMMQMDGVDQ